MNVRAQAWPEADAVFHRDPRWLGSDDAYSVPLAPGRTLWLFGDTFIGDGRDADRANATFIRNSIAVLGGDDPASSAIRFIWGEAGGAPASLFEVDAPNWLWPLDGVRLGARLLLFFMLVRPAQGARDGGIEDWRLLGPLGFFDVFGWTAVLVENPDDEPEDWRWSTVAPLEASPITIGAAACVEGDELFLYGWDRRNRISVSRLPAAEAARGDLSGLQWWSGDGWGGEPAVIVDDGHTEFTVHRRGEKFVLTAMVGRSLGLRTAPAPQGPWSEPVAVFVPEEAARADAFVYAGKAHPELAGADLVATYVSIGTADVTLKDDSLYYPRFARIFEGAT